MSHHGFLPVLLPALGMLPSHVANSHPDNNSTSDMYPQSSHRHSMSPRCLSFQYLSGSPNACLYLPICSHNMLIDTALCMLLSPAAASCRACTIQRAPCTHRAATGTVHTLAATPAVQPFPPTCAPRPSCGATPARAPAQRHVAQCACERSGCPHTSPGATIGAALFA